MKVLLYVVGSLFLASILDAQSQSVSESSPEGMFFIPKGKYEGVQFRDGNVRRTDVTVEAFWMSNEITNKEYREYVQFVRTHPDHLFYWLDGQKARENEGVNWKDHLSEYIIKFKCSDILHDILDTTVWEDKFTDDASRELYAHYFSDTAFDKYPVVGVTNQHARFYCLWRSHMESDGELGNTYELPSETQWEYAAIHSRLADDIEVVREIELSGGKKYRINIALSESFSGPTNEFGLCHLEDNVSEWVMTSSIDDIDSKNVITRGGSWEASSEFDKRNILDPKTQSAAIGFRIIRFDTKW